MRVGPLELLGRVLAKDGPVAANSRAVLLGGGLVERQGGRELRVVSPERRSECLEVCPAGCLVACPVVIWECKAVRRECPVEWVSLGCLVACPVVCLEVCQECPEFQEEWVCLG